MLSSILTHLNQKLGVPSGFGFFEDLAGGGGAVDHADGAVEADAVLLVEGLPVRRGGG